MKYQIYNLGNLDQHTRNLIATDEVDKILAGKLCVVCSQPFATQEEKDNAIVASKNPLKFTHKKCWTIYTEQRKEE